MASGRKVIIEFIGQDKSLSSTARGATTSTSKLGDKLKSVGKMAALGLGAGAVIAGKALFDMGKMAMEDEAAAAKLAQTLKNSAGATDEQIAATEDWISAQGKALGVTDDELRPALQRLTEATGDVGEAQKLASLSMDVSAATGKSLKTVSEALMKAQNGQVSGLSRLGLETKNAAGETLTFEQATKKMSQQFEGAAAKSADTMQGKMARLKLIFDETREEIGAKLLPIAVKLADWFLAEGVPAIEKFAKGFSKTLGPTIKAMVPLIKGVFKVVQGIFKTFAALIRGDWKGVWEGVKTILRGAAEVLKTVLRAAFKALGAIVQAGGELILRGVKAIPGKIRALGGLFKDAGQALIGAMVDGLKNAGGVIAGIAGNVWNAVKSMLNQAIDKINAALQFTISVPGPDINVDMPNIPHLAKGGIVNRPTLALIGEDGPEAVVPLSSKHAPKGSMPGGGTKVVFTGPVYGDPRAFAQFVVRELRKEKRLLGGTSLGLS